jgi:hypothetical protein
MALLGPPRSLPVSVETATTIATLNANLPNDTDPLPEGAGHIRLLKAVLKSTFGSAAVTAADLTAIGGKATILTNLLGGLLSNIAGPILKVTGGLIVTAASVFQAGIVGTSVALSGALSAGSASITGVCAAGTLQGGTLTTGGNVTVGGLLNVSPSGIVTGGTVSGHVVTASVGAVTAATNVVAGNAVLGASLWQAGSQLIPPGELILHSIGVATPAGWVLCDGSNGTPDYYSANPLVSSIGVAIIKRLT